MQFWWWSLPISCENKTRVPNSNTLWPFGSCLKKWINRQVKSKYFPFHQRKTFFFVEFFGINTLNIHSIGKIYFPGPKVVPNIWIKYYWQVYLLGPKSDLKTAVYIVKKDMCNVLAYFNWNCSDISIHLNTSKVHAFSFSA